MMTTVAIFLLSVASLLIFFIPLAQPFRCNVYSHQQRNSFNHLRRKGSIGSNRVLAVNGVNPRQNCGVGTALLASNDESMIGNDNGNGSNQQQLAPPRRETTIRLMENGREANLISRTVPIRSNFSVTVWEWKNSARVVNDYWEAHAEESPETLLDPFGLVSWPGSVLAARELCKHSQDAVYNRTVVVLGAGVGVEAQAAAVLGAKEVIATDIHPTTLQQLEFGVSRNEQLSSSDTIVRTEILDLFRSKKEQPIPSPCDLLVVADVLYNEELATQVCRRCAEALEENPEIRILVTDSQRFVPGFVDELNNALGQVTSSPLDEPLATWKVETMKNFEGSGVIIDEDQTYDVTVQSLWVGL